MQDGSINIFSWDYWESPSDRLLGHPSSIDSIVVLDEEKGVVATGAGDGIVRYVGIQPNTLLGWSVPGTSQVRDLSGKICIDGEEATSDIEILEGANEKEEHWPISALCLSMDGKWLASAAQESIYVGNGHLECSEKGRVAASKKKRKHDSSKKMLDRKKMENTAFLIDLLDDN